MIDCYQETILWLLSSGFWQNVTGGYPVCQMWKSYRQNIQQLFRTGSTEVTSFSFPEQPVLCIDLVLEEDYPLQSCYHIKFQEKLCTYRIIKSDKQRMSFHECRSQTTT